MFAAGGRVLGLCGGYQMLGRLVRDPQGVDGPAGEAPGLGLLDVETEMGGEKSVRPVHGTCARSGAPLAGYEIHMGETTGPDTARPFARIEGRADGAVSADGRIEGCYVHGLFAGDAFRSRWLQGARAGAQSTLAYEPAVEQALDEAGRRSRSRPRRRRALCRRLRGDGIPASERHRRVLVVSREALPVSVCTSSC